MALARITIWVPLQVLTAAALNGEFNNILNNPLALFSPTTGNINFNNNQAVNFGLEKLAGQPAAGTTGRIYFNTVTKQTEVDDGTIIRTLPSVPLSSQGYIIVSASSGDGSWMNLVPGSSGQVLTVISTGVLGYAAIPVSTQGMVLTSQGGTGQNLSTGNPGSVLIVTSSAAGVFKLLNIGTTGQVLTVTSSNGILAFATPAASGASGGGFSSSTVTYFEDFVGPVFTTAFPAILSSQISFGTLVGWVDRLQGLNCEVKSSSGGRLLIQSSDAVGGVLALSSGMPIAAATTALTFLSTWNPQLTMLVGFISTSTGGYRFGWLSSTPVVGDPATGIFFRSSNGNASTFRVVAKVGGVETVIVTTAVQSSSGVMQSFQINISSSGTFATVLTNGVTAGTFTSSQFPVTTTGLVLGFAIDALAAAAAPKVIAVDAIQIVHDRFNTGSTV